MIEIYTDGSSMKNRSGYGYVVLHNGIKIFEKAIECNIGDTNQKMELMAAIDACNWYCNSEYIGHGDCILYSDSAYLINCYDDRWYVRWKNNGWYNTKNEPVANKELWEQLVEYFEDTLISFEKVKGHSDNIYNERADKLATGKAKPMDDIDLTAKKNCDTI